MIRNILDNTTELYMKKYTFGEIFSSRGETLCKNPSDQTVTSEVRAIINFLGVGQWGPNQKEHNKNYDCFHESFRWPIKSNQEQAAITFRWCSSYYNLQGRPAI